MPTFFSAIGFRFFMVMYDIFREPFHIHVTDGKKRICKYWFFEDGKFELADNNGFSKVELQRIQIVLVEKKLN